MIKTASEKVKDWRKQTKKRIIKAFDGKCCMCGYNKCDEALSLHHLNPKEKNFSLSSVRANPKSWKKIVEELKKCVLVCNNCHSEIHAGISKLPENYSTFNEKYTNYKTKKLNTCPICGNLKPTYLITCSKKCAALKSRKVDWTQINLRNLKEKEGLSFTQIGDKLGVSSSAVWKRWKLENG